MRINKSHFFKNSLIIIPILFSIYCILIIGLSYDQIFHIENGERRLKYLFSLGRYDYYDILHLKYYPGLYDTISALIASAFPKSFYYEGFYIINFITGLAAIFGLKKVVKFFFGKSISKIFFIITIFSPLFFGHLAINPKDTIIATANFWIMYYIIKYLKSETDQIRKDTSIKIGIFLGLGLGVRILFIGTLIPIIFFLFLEILLFKRIVKKFNFKKFIYHFIIIFFISYFLLILCWPNVHSNIFINPYNIFIQSLNDKSQGVQLSFFAGKFYQTSETPWNYLIINFFYKIPLIYLCTFLLSFIFINRIKRKMDFDNNFLYYFNLFVIFLILPIFISIIFKLKIHDGLRYFLYLIPIFNVFPSIFIFYLYKNINKLNKIFISIFFIPLILIFMIKFLMITPYQYSYLNLFNDFFLKKDSFENDYWGSSSKELINKFSKKIDNNKTLRIATCGINHINVKYYLKKNNINNFNFVDLNDEFDYAILINRAISDDKIIQKQTCYSKFFEKKVFISVKKSFIDLSKIVEY